MFSFQFKRIRGPQKCGGPRVAGSRRICGNGFVSERRRKTFGRGSLWKLPQLWKKAKRFAAFSHSCLDKTEPKTCSVLSTAPTGSTAVNKRTGNKKTEGSGIHLINPTFFVQ